MLLLSDLFFLGEVMPKFLVKMNVVEAKETTFIIEADDEDDVYDGLGELDYNYFEKNCDWVSVEYEPPIIDDVKDVTNLDQTKGFTILDKNKKIQKRFTNIIKGFSNESA
jgi:hypothetical protein